MYIQVSSNSVSSHVHDEQSYVDNPEPTDNETHIVMFEVSQVNASASTSVDNVGFDTRIVSHITTESGVVLSININQFRLLLDMYISSRYRSIEAHIRNVSQLCIHVIGEFHDYHEYISKN